MANEIVKIGDHVVNVAAIAAAHWEESTLYVHFVGGRFLALERDEGGAELWERIESRAEVVPKVAGVGN